MKDKADTNTPASPQVLNKYKAAADVVNRVLAVLIDQCIAGSNIQSLCRKGDQEIDSLMTGIYKSKKISKGIAFPTCISVNNCACHYSPSSENESSVVLKDGDIVKIELGAHIDGFPILLTHTIIVGNQQITDKRAKLLQCAHSAAEIALHSMQIGSTNIETSDTIQKVLNAFGLNAVEGTISFQLSQNALGQGKHIVLNPTETQKKDILKTEFEEHEVYAVDISISTGEGKVKPNGQDRPTIFKKTDQTYSLKLKTSRAILNEITTSFGPMAFHISHLKDEKKARLGMIECISHQLLQPYEPLYEKDSEYVASFMFTVIISSSGPILLTDFPALSSSIRSEKVTDSTFTSILNKPIKHIKDIVANNSTTSAKN